MVSVPSVETVLSKIVRHNTDILGCVAAHGDHIYTSLPEIYDLIDVDSAMEYLRKACDIAKSRGARSFELRAAMTLGEQLVARGNPAEAKSLISAVYAQFDEGFGTPDLIKAKNVLDSLSQSV